jgi:hypothetical protein
MDYEGFARTVVARFELFEAALVTSLLRMRLAGGHAPQQFAVESTQNRLNFVKSADALAAGYLNEGLGGALTDPAVTGRGALFMRALQRIALDDCRTAQRKLVTSGKNLLGRGDDAMSLLARRADERIEFRTKDSAGRDWKSTGLVRLLARDFAYQVHIDSLARELATQGDFAVVAYMNPEHEHHGLVLSLSGQGDRPSLASVRDTIFHPNATATLIHVPSQP